MALGLENGDRFRKDEAQKSKNAEASLAYPMEHAGSAVKFLVGKSA
jgi:hypothetical protein